MASNSQNRLLVFLKDKEKKNYFRIFKECMYLWITRKEVPFYYFKHLYKKEIPNYKDYLSRKECAKIQFNDDFHKPELVSIIANKLSFSIFCAKNNLPVPELISYNFSSNFNYKSEIIKVENLKQLKNYFQTIFENTKHDSIFIKPLTLFGGKGCFKISKDCLDDDIKKSGEYILNNSCIHEEVVIQHQEINKIHPNCINTIRIETYIDKKGVIHLLSALMRFGVGDSDIDNSHAGGFFVSINLEEGTLKEKGMTFMEFGGQNLFKHPDSGFEFNNFKIPYFNEVQDLVIKATTYIPDRYIGWDIAISTKGPIIIEANERTNVYGANIAYGGYRKHPLFKEILEETKNTDLKKSRHI